MTRPVQIIERHDVFKKFIFRIEQVTFRHERFDGSMSQEITRLILQRGDCVAMLLHDAAADVILLCEQIRVPTLDNGPGWILELPAGVVEKGEAPEECARRESLEETGYELGDIEPVACVYLSPGGSSERAFVVYASISVDRRVASGGGLAEEGEDIRILHVATDEAIAMAHGGRIQDAKTLIAIQWLAARRSAK